MEQVAELLGVELGEKFKINFHGDISSDEYYIDETSIHEVCDGRVNDYCYPLLIALLNGSDTVVKLPKNILTKKEKELEEKEELLKKRLVASYKAGSTSYLDVLLSSGSLTSFLSNYYLVEQISENDTKFNLVWNQGVTNTIASAADAKDITYTLYSCTGADDVTTSSEFEEKLSICSSCISIVSACFFKASTIFLQVSISFSIFILY